MNAIISGRAGVALLLDGDSLVSFDVDDLDTLLPRRHSDVRLLFGEAPDLQFIEDIDHGQAASELKRAFDRSSALDLALIILDSELSDEVREEAAEELEQLVSDPQIIESLENVLYGRPLPEAADIAGALKRCDSERTPNLSAALQILEGFQPTIRDVCGAWDELPPQLFGGNEEKNEFQLVAIREGLFRELALKGVGRMGIGQIQMRAGLNPAVTALKNYREVLQQWTKPFRPREVNPDLRHEADEDSRQKVQAQRRQRGRRQGIDRKAALDKAQSQKALITKAMRRRDLERARKVVDELVGFQLEHGEPIHIVKSLCDLASEAKELGIYSLQIELIERAIGIVPDDGWTWAQYADALLKGRRLSEALDAYEQASAFGQRAIAMDGRAEVLKALGRLPEALAAYDAAVAEFPENVVAKNSRAETLRALGRLPEALAAYDAAIAEHPEDVVAKAGRAEVLKALGRLPEALAAYDAAIAEHPENVVAKRGRSCILVALHRYDEALAHLPDANPVALDDWIGYHIRGMILLRTGKIDEAVRIFEHGVKDNPLPSSKEYFRSALAVAHLRRREFVKAGHVLAEVTTPSLQPQANVLRLHSFGASGDYERAATAYRNLAHKPWFISDELVNELHRKYMLKEEPRHDDEWVYEQEDDMLLLGANQQAVIFQTTSSYSM
jgi:tetratricopeptide (TPR) repeat protein